MTSTTHNTPLRSYYPAPAWINSRPTDTDDPFTAQTPDTNDPFEGLSEADLLNIEADRRETARYNDTPYALIYNNADLL